MTQHILGNILAFNMTLIMLLIIRVAIHNIELLYNAGAVVIRVAMGTYKMPIVMFKIICAIWSDRKNTKTPL